MEDTTKITPSQARGARDETRLLLLRRPNNDTQNRLREKHENVVHIRGSRIIRTISFQQTWPIVLICVHRINMRPTNTRERRLTATIIMIRKVFLQLAQQNFRRSAWDLVLKCIASSSNICALSSNRSKFSPRSIALSMVSLMTFLTSLTWPLTCQRISNEFTYKQLVQTKIQRNIQNQAQSAFPARDGN